MFYFSLTFALICFLVFLFFEMKHQFLRAFFFKALASFSFIAVVPLSLLDHLGGSSLSGVLYLLGYAGLIMMGLICGFTGDLILALRTFHQPEKEHKIIFAGTIAFAFGHVFYLWALLQLVDFSWLAILFSCMVTALIFVLGTKLLKLNFGKSLIPSIIYSFLLFLMVGMTIFGYRDFPKGSFAIVIMISSILFGLSDIVLSQIYFAGKETNPLKALNLSLYYFAQIGIASSVFLLLIS